MELNSYLLLFLVVTDSNVRHEEMSEDILIFWIVFSCIRVELCDFLVCLCVCVCACAYVCADTYMYIS